MIDDADAAEVYSVRNVKHARKSHRCSECGRTIEVNEPYQYTSMVYDGEHSAFHTCRHCLVACEWLILQCSGFLHQGVLEDIMEHADVYSKTQSYWLRRLEVGMKRKWKRFDGVGLMPLGKVPPVIEEPRA